MSKYYFFDFGIVRRMRRYTSLAPKTESYGKEEMLLEKYIIVSLDETPRRPLVDPDIQILPWKQFIQQLWSKES